MKLIEAVKKPFKAIINLLIKYQDWSYERRFKKLPLDVQKAYKRLKLDPKHLCKKGKWN